MILCAHDFGTSVPRASNKPGVMEGRRAYFLNNTTCPWPRGKGARLPPWIGGFDSRRALLTTIEMRNLVDAGVTRRGGGLQSRFQWVRLPPASLITMAMTVSVQRRVGHHSGSGSTRSVYDPKKKCGESAEADSPPISISPNRQRAHSCLFKRMRSLAPSEVALFG